jgi:hypothetical protein
MSTLVWKNLGIASAVFVAIALFDKIPLLGGWLGWLISLGLWVYFANRFVDSAAPQLKQASNPSVPAMGWCALIGATSALVGALTSLVIDAASTSAAANSNNAAGVFTGTIGVYASLIGLVIWPLVGAVVCGLFGLIWGGRLSTPAPAQASLAVGTLSPDGKMYWTGSTWTPVPSATPAGSSSSESQLGP